MVFLSVPFLLDKDPQKAAFHLAHTGEDAGEGVAARAGDWPDALPLQSGSKEEIRSGAKLLKGPDPHSAPPPPDSHDRLQKRSSKM